MQRKQELDHREYDFIILGGGTAGCLLARLLAEADIGSVALIEAGGASADVRTIAPALYLRTFKSRLDWQFATEPQAFLKGRRIPWPRGKTLGGSSAINALIYLQAAAADFNRWSLNGCDEWDWQSLSRRLLPPNSMLRCPYSWLPLSAIQSPHPWSTSFIQACVASGIEQRDEWTQSENQTCGLYSLTHHNGRRQHTGLQLSEMLARGKLDVLHGMTINKLQLVDGRVQSVELVDCERRTIRLSVSGEVILCAGTIGSPSVLQRSGIGPAELLRGVGVSPQVDLPGVGANLQDHLVMPLIYRAKDNIGLPARFDAAARKHFRQPNDAAGCGPLGSNIAEAGALFTVDQFSIDGGETPDFQIHFTPTHYLKYPSRHAPTDHCTLAVTDLHPRSRGRLSITGSDPHASPNIDPAYMSHEEDMPRTLGAIDVTRSLASNEALREIIADEVLPGRRRTDVGSIVRCVETYAMSIYHPVGTCRMGTDANAVVDTNLRVHGINNLRIADASVLPDLPSGNTQAITMLVAYVASRLLAAGR